MAHKAKDGTEYTNRMMATRHNARTDANKADKAPAPQDQATDSTPQDADRAPDADSHVDALLDMGMSPDDIHEAAKKRSGHSQEQAPEQSSALSSIPGM